MMNDVEITLSIAGHLGKRSERKKAPARVVEEMNQSVWMDVNLNIEKVNA